MSYGNEKYITPVEHESIKIEEEAPPPPYSMHHWGSRLCIPCGFTKKLGKASLIITLCLVLTAYQRGLCFAGNNAPVHDVASSQIKVAPTMVSLAANEASITSAIDAQVVVTTQAPMKVLLTPAITIQAPTKPPIQTPTTQPSTKAQWDWKSQSYTLSCENSFLTGTFLSADCLTISKKHSAKHSKLDLNCVIANIDGVLQWADKGTVANFKDSSKEYYITTEYGGSVTLYGKCQTMQGLYMDCGLMLNEGIENIDGELSSAHGQKCTNVMSDASDECMVPIPIIHICLY